MSAGLKMIVGHSHAEENARSERARMNGRKTDKQGPRWMSEKQPWEECEEGEVGGRGLSTAEGAARSLKCTCEENKLPPPEYCRAACK